MTDDIVTRLRAERDDARREVCNLVASNRDREQVVPVMGFATALSSMIRSPVHPESIARARAWDCFDEPRR